MFGITEVVDVPVTAGARIDSLEMAAGHQRLEVIDLRDPLDHRTPPEWCQRGNRYLASPAHDEAEAILRPVTGYGPSLILVPLGPQ